MKKPKISQISVARLYNLGNYEHVRFELTVEVPAGASAKQTLFDLAAIVARLKPVKKPYDFDTAMQVLNKSQEELNEFEKEHLDQYMQQVKDYSALKALQRSAFEKLDALGGTSKRKDAKLSWENEEAPW